MWQVWVACVYAYTGSFYIFKRSLAMRCPSDDFSEFLPAVFRQPEGLCVLAIGVKVKEGTVVLEVCGEVWSVEDFAITAPREG